MKAIDFEMLHRALGGALLCLLLTRYTKEELEDEELVRTEEKTARVTSQALAPILWQALLSISDADDN